MSSSRAPVSAPLTPTGIRWSPSSGTKYVAGRLSHDTFLHRVNVVLESRRQADLPPLVADLPARATRAADWSAGSAAPGPASPGSAAQAAASARESRASRAAPALRTVTPASSGPPGP